MTNIHSKRFYTFFWKINHHPGLPQHQNAMSEILNLMMIFIKKKSAQKIHQNNLWKRWKWLILSQLSKRKPRFAKLRHKWQWQWPLQTFAVSSPQQFCPWVQKQIPAGNMVDHILGQNHSVAPYFRNANWLKRVTSPPPPPPYFERPNQKNKLSMFGDDLAFGPQLLSSLDESWHEKFEKSDTSSLSCFKKLRKSLYINKPSIRRYQVAPDSICS